MRIHRSLAAALVALALVAGACGKSDGTSSKKGQDGAGSSALQQVLAAADVTQKAGSSKIAMTADMSFGGQTIDMSGEGAFDYAKKLGSMVFKMSGAQIPAQLGSFEIRFVGKVLYMKFPPEFAQLAPGLKQWLKIDLEAMAKQGGGSIPGMNSFGAQDPTSALAFLKGAKDVKEVGNETVRGAQTVHFSMRADLVKALESLPADQRDALEGMLGQFGVKDLDELAEFKEFAQKAGLDNIPMDLWIDKDGRVRRVKFLMDLSKLMAEASAASPGAAPTTGSVDMSMDFFDFGTPVSVTAPAASDVSDFSELSRLGSGG